ncbi:MAG: methionyl-tRNA formyltransferase [Acidobacteria bacterium]|nr:methionyl-tRNA formyltransferase [Acidobacteriota bacterium]
MVAPASPLRIAFFGTPAFAVPTLAALAGSHPIVVVVTQPDRPKGRGHRSRASPVMLAASERGIPVLQPERLKDPAFLDALGAHRADLGVVAAFGKILPDEVLSLPRLGLVNVHASLLPRYRGASPVQRAVMNGDAETGVTIMRVVKALDAGPMLATARRPIGPDETSEQVERDLADLGARLLVKTLADLTGGTSTETPQDDRQATYAPRLTKEEGHIRWEDTATAISNRVRGLHPWPHAYTFLQGRRLIILKTAAETRSPTTASRSPGSIVRAEGDELLVAGGHDTVVRILELQPEGRRPMTAREFLAGHAQLSGARLT